VKKIDLSAARIQWSALTTLEIKFVLTEAIQYGDTVLVERARRALARR